MNKVCLEAGGRLLDEHQSPSREARLVFSYLVYERARPVRRDALAEVVWPQSLPSAWDTALSALVSKLRNLLGQLELPAGAAGIFSRFGCYQLQVPAGTWVDIEAAAQALDEAERALRAGALTRAWGPANIAVTIGRRPFLPDEDGLWVDLQTRRLQEVLARGLECLSAISLRNREAALAVQYATELVTREPFRETGYQHLMRAYAAAGNRAEALRTYEQCRTLLTEEIGIDPSPETHGLYLHLLRSRSSAS